MSKWKENMGPELRLYLERGQWSSSWEFLLYLTFFTSLIILVHFGCNSKAKSINIKVQFSIFRFLCHCPSLSSVQSLSHVQLFATPWTAARQATLSITNSRSLLKLMSIELVMPSNHLIFCSPFPFPPSIFLSIRVFSNESVLHIRWPKYWSFSISTSNEYSGLISFRMDWSDLLAVQGSLKSLLQHHSSKASVLRCSALIVQLSHPYMTSGKTIALNRWTFVGKVMSRLFNMLSRLGHNISSKEQVSFNFMTAVTICSDFEAPKYKVCHYLQFPHLFAMRWWDQMPWSWVSECWVLSQLFHSLLSLSSRGSLILCFLP